MHEKIYTHGYPVKDNLALGIDSERIINSIDYSQLDGERAQIIFSKAVQFFERVFEGEETARTLRLKITSPEDLRALNLSQDAYRHIAKGHGLSPTDKKQMSNTIKDLRGLCEDLAEGRIEDINSEQLGILCDFFKFIKKTAHDAWHKAHPIEVVRIHSWQRE